MPDNAWAEYLQGCRLTSKFVKNLSAAARAAGLTPSELHRIEGGDVQPTPQQCVALLRVYGTVPPCACGCGRDLRIGDRKGPSI